MRRLPFTLAVVACTSSAPAPSPPADAGPGPGRMCAITSQYDPCGGRAPNACKGRCFFACQAWCDPGFADCNHDVTDGCEVDLLHDPQSCGACNATAPACAGGLGGPAPETLGDCGFTARGLAVDATTVYAMCDGDLTAMPKQGGAGARLVAKGEWGDPRAGLAVDGGFLYWAWPSIAKSGAIRRMPLSGGAIETVVLGVNPASNLLFHAGVVYFADRDSGEGASGSRIVDGTGRTVLTAGSEVSLVAIGDVLYVHDGGRVRSVRFDGTDVKDVTTSIRAIATDGSALFLVGATWFRSYQDGNLSLSLGPIPFEIAGATMTVGSKTIYGRGWATYDDGCLGGQGAEIVAAIDAGKGGAVVRARITGHDGILSSSEIIDQLAEDESYVYFATSSYSLARPGTIARFAK